MTTKIGKKVITKYLLPYLSQSHLGRKPKVPLWRIVQAIIYKLKTGCQWRELPMRPFSPKVSISCKTVFYHYNKWSQDGSLARLWDALLGLHKSHLDLSCVQLDGSQTPAKRGGEAVGYQDRKKCKTTNALFLTDNQGLPVAISMPVSGNHHDVFEVEKSLPKMLSDLQRVGIATEGLFMNADAGFDCEKVQEICEQAEIFPNIKPNKRNTKEVQMTDNQYIFDELLYMHRYCVERTNAWLDGFKNLALRYETKNKNWLAWHFLAFSIILIRNNF